MGYFHIQELLPSCFLDYTSLHPHQPAECKNGYRSTFSLVLGIMKLLIRLICIQNGILLSYNM